MQAAVDDGDAGETARLASRARQGASDGAGHRGLLLEFDADTAARGVLEGLLGLVGDAVALETVNEEQSGYSEREACLSGCQRALTQGQTLRGVVAHSSSEIPVSLSTAASAEAPLAPISLRLTLRTRGGAGMVGEQACQWALTQRRTLRGGGALERGHSAPLERLANLSDALGGVGAGPEEIDATERVFNQAAKG